MFVCSARDTLPSDHTHQANPGRVGYFRVNYSTAMFEKLFVALKNGQLGEKDRLAIQEDASALVS